MSPSNNTQPGRFMRLLVAFNRWRRRTFWRHQWSYRNPYDRTCKVCGRNEVEHYVIDPTKGFWEVFNKGDEAKHYF